MGGISRGFPYRADYTASMSVLVATLDLFSIEIDPLIWCMAREQSLEDVPESTGHVGFIPRCHEQNQGRDHIPNRPSWRRGGEAGLVTRARYLTRPSILIW